MTDFAIVLMGNIARHRECFQIHLGPHDRRSETQQDTAFKPFNRRSEDQKVRVACLTKCTAIAVRMFVDDVISNTDMNGNGNANRYAAAKTLKSRCR